MFDFLSTKGLPQSSLRKQLIDQGGHFLGGLAIALVLSLILPKLIAIGIVAAFALGREFLQHNSLDLGKGSRLDVTFWVLGAVATLLI